MNNQHPTQNNVKKRSVLFYLAVSATLIFSFVLIILFLFWVTREKMPSNDRSFLTSVETKLDDYLLENGTYPTEISELGLPPSEESRFERVHGGQYFFTYDARGRSISETENLCSYTITYQNSYTDSFGLNTGNFLHKSTVNNC